MKRTGKAFVVPERSERNVYIMRKNYLRMIITVILTITLVLPGTQVFAATTNPTLPTAAFTLPTPVSNVINQWRLYGEDKGVSTTTGYAHVGVDMMCGSVNVYPALATGQTATVVQSVPESQGGDYGNYVVIKHSSQTNSNDIYTLYAHLASRSVANGATLTPTTSIGVAGTTGNSSGVHLHFEVRYMNNAYGSVLNPEMFFSRSKVSGRSVLYGYVYGADTYSISGVKITGLGKDSAVCDSRSYGSSLTYLPVNSSTKVRDIYNFDINYLVGEAQTGTKTVTFSKSGYQTQNRSITLTSGGSYRLPIQF